MARIGFILKPDKTEAGQLLEQLVGTLAAADHECFVTMEDQVAPAGASIVPESELQHACDFVVSLGGDGTILRASKLVADSGRPVLGVHLGRLGFLTGFAAESAEKAVFSAIEGKLKHTERTRLRVSIIRPGGTEVVRTALNDAVVHQGAMARLVSLAVTLDDQFVADYKADGLIVATPTGSTAYSMAAGGPIIVPGHAAMVITPICAHSLTNRPLIVPSNSTIRFRLGPEARGVVLTVDGQWAHSFNPEDEVTITATAQPLRLFDAGESFFDVMRDKLHWGARTQR